jgi:hypothetical protein
MVVGDRETCPFLCLWFYVCGEQEMGNFPAGGQEFWENPNNRTDYNKN